MRVSVVSEVELGSPRAHFINIVKTGGGFARLGHETTALCREPTDGSTPESVASAMSEPSLAWRTAPWGLDDDAFAAWAAEMSAGADLAYCRTFRGALACAQGGLATVLETHAYIGDTNPDLCDAIAASAFRTDPIGAIVTISHRLAEHYIQRGAPRGRVHVVPDGVDVDLFTPPESQTLPATPMSIRPGARVLYSGHLYDYKGIPTVIEAATLLEGVTTHLLGGIEEDIERVRGQAEQTAPGRVVVHGRVDHAQVPAWLWNADALLLPPSATEPSKDWTSPVKLGEYLASGVPIVASRIPALLDLLGENDAFWFEPDDAGDLARAVRRALRESNGAAVSRRARAGELANAFSYTRRAERIIEAASLAVEQIGA